jgi:hypothetical protein
VLRAEYLALAVAREDWGKAASKAKHYPRPIANYVPRGKVAKGPERGVKRA